MSETPGVRIAHFFLALLHFPLSYLWFSIGDPDLGYLWLGTGFGWLITAIVYDTYFFTDIDEDLKHRMFKIDVAVFFLGGIIGFFIDGIRGSAYGVCIGTISSLLGGFLYLLFFYDEEEF